MQRHGHEPIRSNSLYKEDRANASRKSPHLPVVLLVNRQDLNNDLERLWENEHDAWVARTLLELLEPEFTASHWQAFTRQVMDGRPAAQVAGELGMSVNAVLIAKSRVLRRFRDEIQGLIE